MTHLLQLQTMPAEAGGTEQLNHTCSGGLSAMSLLTCSEFSATSIILCPNLAES